MFFRHFWVPPLICGLLFAGCTARTAWTAQACADYANCHRPCYSEPGSGDKKEQPTAERNQQNSKPASDSMQQDSKSEDKSQIERVAEIMRASTESTIQALSEIFNK